MHYISRCCSRLGYLTLLMLVGGGCAPEVIKFKEVETVTLAPATDPRIVTEVKARLASVPGLAGPYRVTASFDGSRVTLTGTAYRRADIERIVQRIGSVPGVSGVDNRIKSTAPVNDEAIQTQVLEALELDPDLRGYGVTASVRGGIVTLRGDLPNSCLIDKALTQVMMVDGVKDLKNEVTMSGKPYRPSAHCPGYAGDASQGS